MKAIAPFLIAPFLLAACGERVIQPAPLAVQQAPDTSALGAGAATGVLGAGPAMQACSRVVVEDVLQRINAARASGFRCGRRAMGPVAPLKWDSSLYSAAERHSVDMARRNYFEHRSPDGADVKTRASAAHYKFRMMGENIAAGVHSMPEAMQAWFQSPGHCENIMTAEFQDVAVACAVQAGSEWGTYWTMVLGRK
ncbi:CAP domain-containing protein [Ramlibacter alkalitolerans]|uniref:CAP domain-containing protein n=1 Tax=Ramlibacter alkalitolerans TaxID=2039631 RepID=A0ABS1JQB8_9BURK|nr:CAP domain-containing protein [Ramlibacter alkalitolerans]